MRLKSEDIPIAQEIRRGNDDPQCRIEQAVRVDSPSAFHVVVRRVHESSSSFLPSTSKVVRFSESQYAIANSVTIKLRTAGYYRDLEESDGCGIGDAEEATLRRNTDFATFQREAGQTPMPGAHHVQTTLTYRSEHWILCTSIAPTPLTGMDSMRTSICQSYDSATLIANPSQFARQLGIDFGNTMRPSDLKHPGPILWTSLPLVFVDHGPVVYTESPSDVVERLPKASWGLVTPFVKRTHFSGQKEYRFVVSIGGLGDPKERSLDLTITEELRALTHLIE